MKTTVKIFGIFNLIFFLNYCGGNSLVEDGFNLNTDQTGRVEIMLTQHLGDGSALNLSSENTKVIEDNGFGYRVELTQFKIHLHDFTFISEGDDPSCPEGIRAQIELHQNYDLMQEDLFTTFLGMGEVPNISFCQYQVNLGLPLAPSQHAKLENHSHEESHGETHGENFTFKIAGTYQRENEAAREFSLVGTQALTYQAHYLTAEHGGKAEQHSFHFAHGEEDENGELPVQSIVFGIRYNLLVSVDFSKPEHELIGEINQRLVNEAFHQHTKNTHGHHQNLHDHGSHAH